MAARGTTTTVSRERSVDDLSSPSVDDMDVTEKFPVHKRKDNPHMKDDKVLMLNPWKLSDEEGEYSQAWVKYMKSRLPQSLAKCQWITRRRVW